MVKNWKHDRQPAVTSPLSAAPAAPDRDPAIAEPTGESSTEIRHYHKHHRGAGAAILRETAQGVTLSSLAADSEVRRLLKDSSLSRLAKYRWLVVGNRSYWYLLWYELVTMLTAAMPGALGLWLRARLYRSLFSSLGRGVVIGRNVTIRHPHRIHLGDNVILDDNVVLDGKGDEETSIRIGPGAIIGRNSMLVCKGGTIDIGAAANVSVNCTMISESSLVIGTKTLVAGHCYLCAGGNHGTADLRVPFVDQPRTSKGGIDVGEDCWLCACATVLDGVRIGPHVIVAAGAVVTNSVSSYRVVGGVPAKELYDRAAERDQMP